MVENRAAPRCVLDLKAVLGEGPVWLPQDGTVWFVDIPQARIHRFEPGSGAHRTWNAPDRVAFLLPLDDGGFLCGMPDGLRRFDPVTGLFSPPHAVEADLPGNRLNDGTVDALGRIWFGSMDDAEQEASGGIYGIAARDGTLRVTRYDEGYVVSNGPAVSPDGRTLYACDSSRQTIYAFDIADDGRLMEKRLFARLEQGYPDGITADSEGGLWCCVFGGGRAMRFAPDGSVTDVVPFPCTYVTKLALGGEDRRTAYVTTARRDLTTEQAAREPEAGGVFTFRVTVPGQAQCSFRMQADQGLPTGDHPLAG